MDSVKNNIAVFTNKSFEKCETFIKMQLDGIDQNVFHYWGDSTPFNLNLSNSIWNKICQYLTKKKLNQEKVLINDLKKKKIKMVLAQYGMTGAKLIGICEKMDLPIIVHFHGHDASRRSILSRYSDEYKEVFKYNKTKIISVSKVMTHKLIELGCPKDKIILNPCAPHDSFQSLNPRQDSNEFVFVGRFVEKKAPHLLITSFYRVLKYHPNAILKLIGSGPLLDSCKDLAASLNIQKSVLFLGKLSREEIQKHFEGALGYVQHSITAQDGDMEGTPVSVLEANASGLPVISTFHAGIADVVIHGENGLLSKEKDLSSMRDHMIWCLENKDKAFEMGRKGKNNVIENYNLAQHLRNLNSLINNTL